MGGAWEPGGRGGCSHWAEAERGRLSRVVEYQRGQKQAAENLSWETKVEMQ